MASSSASFAACDRPFSRLGIWALLLVNRIIPVVHAQSLASVAAAHPELSTFFSQLNQSSMVTQMLSSGQYTIFAPTNDAWQNQSGLVIANTRDGLLQYHILDSTYSSTQLQQEAPAILETTLTSSNYTNLSGGQVVKVSHHNGQLQVMSGAFSNSSIVTPDIAFDHGVIHTVSKLFNIPSTMGMEVVYTNLAAFVELGSMFSDISGSNLQYATTWQQVRDSTLLAPNNTASVNKTYIESLSGTDALLLMQYHEISGQRLYVPELKNGQQFRTFAGLNVTVWIVNGTTYINDSPITMTDLFAQNGVLQVLGKPLNPNNTHAAPPGATGTASAAQSSTSSTGTSSSSSSSSSTGVGVGVGVGVGIVVLLLIAGWLFLRRRKQRSKRISAEPILEDNAMELEGAQRTELDDASRNEIGGVPRSELDSKKGFDDPKQWRVSGAFEMHDPSTIRERGEMAAEEGFPVKKEANHEVHELP